MAEKRVSVRLAALGGRHVHAELEGVGEAGAKGLGRLSREMELANTRMAAFARRAGLALGAAAAAATASLGLIVRSTAESAAQIRQFAQVANATPEALQRWSAGARTVGIEQEKLADILKDVNDRVGDFLQTGGGPMADFFENVAPRVGVTADQFARLSGPEALQLYVDTLERRSEPAGDDLLSRGNSLGRHAIDPPPAERRGRDGAAWGSGLGPRRGAGQ